MKKFAIKASIIIHNLLTVDLQWSSYDAELENALCEFFVRMVKFR